MSGLSLAAAVTGPALTTNAWTLAIALILLGLGNGALDVSVGGTRSPGDPLLFRPSLDYFGMRAAGGTESLVSDSVVLFGVHEGCVHRGANDRGSPLGVMMIECFQRTFSYSQRTPSYLPQPYSRHNVPSEVNTCSIEEGSSCI